MSLEECPLLSLKLLRGCFVAISMFNLPKDSDKERYWSYLSLNFTSCLPHRSLHYAGIEYHIDWNKVAHVHSEKMVAGTRRKCATPSLRIAQLYILNSEIVSNEHLEGGYQT